MHGLFPFTQESFQRFPLENAYIPEVQKRLSLARQIDKILRKDSQVFTFDLSGDIFKY